MGIEEVEAGAIRWGMKLASELNVGKLCRNRLHECGVGFEAKETSQDPSGKIDE